MKQYVLWNTFTSGSEGCGTSKKPRWRSIWTFFCWIRQMRGKKIAFNWKSFLTWGGIRLLNVESQTQAERTLGQDKCWGKHLKRWAIFIDYHSAIVLWWSDAQNKWWMERQLFLFPENTRVGQKYSSDDFFGQKLPPNLLVVPGEVACQAAELFWVKSKLWVKPEKPKKMVGNVGFPTLGSSAVGRSPALWWWHRPGGGEGSALLQNSG